MARDNFTKAVIEKLRTRVAHRCSNPECRVPTIGPATNSDRAASIGVAAHITAAAVGGPRYDAYLSEKARKSMGNGIWLCSNCSTVIDKDVERYTVDLLKLWKQEAEQQAKQELGKKLPSRNDAIDTLTTAFTGTSARLIPDAISNIHKASTNALEALDPRFVVKSVFTEGMTQFGLFPKQDVAVTMKIQRERAQEFADKYNQLIEHGFDLTIDGAAISFEGSKLLEEISSNLVNGTFKLTSHKKKATQKIWLVNNKKSVTENFDDIIGEICPGRQSISFSGTACNDLFAFKYQLRPTSGSNTTTVNMAINFAGWSGLDVRALPYFNKIHSFFENISAGWNFATALEIDGLEVLRSKEFLIDKPDFIREICQILTIIDLARILANSVNIKISFDSDFSFTEDEYDAFQNAVKIAEGKAVFHKDDLENNISCDFIVDKELKSLEQLQQCSEPMNLEYIEMNGSAVRVFGQDILLPRKVVRVCAALPRISTAVDKEKLSHGDVVKVELIPTEGFEVRIEYKKPEN